MAYDLPMIVKVDFKSIEDVGEKTKRSINIVYRNNIIKSPAAKTFFYFCVSKNKSYSCSQSQK